jgi:gluconokinase
VIRVRSWPSPAHPSQSGDVGLAPGVVIDPGLVLLLNLLCEATAMTQGDEMPEDTDGRRKREPVVLVVMGVSGTGKSTVGGLLAERLGWDLAEGDDLHPPSNVAKMASGQPLTDGDRWPWLDKVGTWIRSHTESGKPGVITCSALRKVYRDRLRGPGVVFVHLHGSKEEIAAMISARLDHFMPPALLDSQLETLEPLEPDEDGIVVPLRPKPEEEVDDVIHRLGLGHASPRAYES